MVGTFWVVVLLGNRKQTTHFLGSPLRQTVCRGSRPVMFLGLKYDKAEQLGLTSVPWAQVMRVLFLLGGRKQAKGSHQHPPRSCLLGTVGEESSSLDHICGCLSLWLLKGQGRKPFFGAPSSEIKFIHVLYGSRGTFHFHSFQGSICF